MICHRLRQAKEALAVEEERRQQAAGFMGHRQRETSMSMMRPVSGSGSRSDSAIEYGKIENSGGRCW